MPVTRPRITSITRNVLMPDGTTKVHTIDPVRCKALVWSDRAVQVFGTFYVEGGPAEGKRRLREDFLRHFPQAAALIGDQPDQTTPAFLTKIGINSVNG